MTYDADCKIQRGEREAAREVLAISEKNLQRYRQKGSEVASSNDRRVFKVPNYRAMPWPVVTGPDITLEFDPNNKDLGRASIGAAEFDEPFSNAGSSGRDIKKPSFGSPGIAFAGTSNLQAMEKSSFVGSQEDIPLYQQLASSIKMDFESIAQPGDITGSQSMAQNYLGSSLGSSIGNLEADPDDTRPAAHNVGIYGGSLHEGSAGGQGAHTGHAGHAGHTGHAKQENNLYGSSEKYHRDPAIERPQRPLNERLVRAVQGAIYDFLHYSEISEEHLKNSDCTSKIVYIFFRDNRGPYLGLICLAGVVALLLSFKLSSKS
jgi:hypothetical protein